MQGWEQRMSAEREELTDKINKAKEFLASEEGGLLDTRDSNLLVWQVEAMEEYLHWLTVRIERQERKAKGEPEPSDDDDVPF